MTSSSLFSLALLALLSLMRVERPTDLAFDLDSFKMTKRPLGNPTTILVHSNALM